MPVGSGARHPPGRARVLLLLAAGCILGIGLLAWTGIDGATGLDGRGGEAHRTGFQARGDAATDDPESRAEWAQERQPLPSEEVRPEGLCRGELWVVGSGVRRLARGAARIHLVAEDDVRPPGGANRASSQGAPVRFVYVPGDDPSMDHLRPAVFDHAAIETRDGRWEMPVPEEDHVVFTVEAEEQRARILRGRTVKKGQTRAVVEVRLLGSGALAVHDARDGRPLEGLRVLEVPAPSRTGPLHIDYSAGLRFTLGAMDGPERRTPPSPPDWATPLCEEGRSPIRVPLGEHDRELWVGKPGYQWEKVEWPSSRASATVDLRRSGALEVRLRGLGQRPGLLDLRVVRGAQVVAGWHSVRRDRILSLEEVGSGEHRVVLVRNHRNARSTVYDAAHRVEPGTCTTLDLDLVALVPEEAAGRLSVTVRCPSLELARRDELRLQLYDVERGWLGIPTFEQPLEGLPPDPEGYRASFPDLPVGEYTVAIAPCGLRAVVSVEANEEAEVHLDLGDLAFLRVWPVDAEGEPDPAAGRRSRLVWRQEPGETMVRAADSASARELSWDVDTGVGSLLRRARWGGESWSVLCGPGRVTLLALDEGGRGGSEVATVRVLAGPNDTTLRCGEGERVELSVALKGIAESDCGALPGLLALSVEPAGGVGECSFVTRLEDDPRSPGVTRFVLHLSSAGPYHVRQPEIPGYRALSVSPAPVLATGAEDGEVVMEWSPSDR